MDDLIMNRLFEHIDKMDEGLVSMLRQYKSYSEQKIPTICILCSDKKLRAEVDKIFTIRDDLCVDVIVTSDEISDDEKYRAMLCDALVVCTRAKNIAPKGLYDLLKHISCLEKQVFVVLAGWESIERNVAMTKARSERVSVEFEFARIMDVTCVFNTQCEGFSTWDNAFDPLAIHFSEKFEMLHHDQDERVYKYLMKYLEDFYASSRTNINKEIAILNNAEKVAMAKQDYYVVRFSNLAVSVQEVVDSVRRSIEDVSYYDIVNENKNESLTDIYSRSGVEAQKFAKDYLIQEYKRRVALLKDQSNEKVRIDNENCVTECINELSTMVDELSKLKYLPKDSLDSLAVVCDEKSELEKIVNRYEASAGILIDNILDRIPAKVGEYRYEMKFSVEARDTGKELLGIAKNVMSELFSDAKKDSSNSSICEEVESEIKKSAGEEDQALMIDKFQNDIEQLIFYSRNACGEMANNCAKSIKDDMEKFANSILKIHFGTIIKEIEGMQVQMSKILEEYYLEY